MPAAIFPPALAPTYIHDLFHGLFAADVIEGRLADQQLVGQHPQAPQVHRVVVLHALQDLRGGVIKGAAVGLAPVGADGSPAEVTQLAHALNKMAFTWDMTMFSGLMSRWAISFSCRYLTAEATCLILTATSASPRVLFFLKCVNRVPSSMYSSTKYSEVLSSKLVQSETMFSWQRKLCSLSSRMNWSIIMWDRIMSLGTFLIAHSHPVGLCTAWYTTPNLPSPRLFPNTKLFTYTQFIVSVSFLAEGLLTPLLAVLVYEVALGLNSYFSYFQYFQYLVLVGLGDLLTQLVSYFSRAETLDLYLSRLKLLAVVVAVSEAPGVRSSYSFLSYLGVQCISLSQSFFFLNPPFASSMSFGLVRYYFLSSRQSSLEPEAELLQETRLAESALYVDNVCQSDQLILSLASSLLRRSSLSFLIYSLILLVVSSWVLSCSAVLAYFFSFSSSSKFLYLLASLGLQKLLQFLSQPPAFLAPQLGEVLAPVPPTVESSYLAIMSLILALPRVSKVARRLLYSSGSLLMSLQSLAQRQDSLSLLPNQLPQLLLVVVLHYLRQPVPWLAGGLVTVMRVVSNLLKSPEPLRQLGEVEAPLQLLLVKQSQVLSRMGPAQSNTPILIIIMRCWLWKQAKSYHSQFHFNFVPALIYWPIGYKPGLVYKHKQKMTENQIQYKDIRTQMLEALAKYNIKQVDVAREAGINHSTLSLWLQGSVKGNYINIEGDLADWLDCLYSGRPRYTALNKAINKQFNLVPTALSIKRKRAIEIEEDLIPIHLELEPDGKKYKEMFCWNINEPYFTPEEYVRLLVAENSLLVPFETQIVETIKKAVSHHRAHRPKVEECIKILELDIKVDNVCLKDRFEWDINDPTNSPEDFALSLASELNLNGEFVVKIAHQIREQLLYYRRSHHHEVALKAEDNQLMDMKKSTRNLISLSGSYAGPIAERIGADNYLRSGHGEEWEPQIELLDAGQVRKFQKFEERKNRYARRTR